jgi:hypothetical protein
LQADAQQQVADAEDRREQQQRIDIGEERHPGAADDQQTSTGPDHLDLVTAVDHPADLDCEDDRKNGKRRGQDADPGSRQSEFNGAVGGGDADDRNDREFEERGRQHGDEETVIHLRRELPLSCRAIGDRIRH